ncbi:MAG: glycine cleavage T C-terminal barrel domain-containing protein [Candidatus Phaeomarinobacter sp.]
MSQPSSDLRTWDQAVRPTPLHQRTSEFNVTNQWTTELGWTLPDVYQGVEAEHAALRNACTLSDLNALVTYQLAGRDVGAYLNRLAGGCGGNVKTGASRRVVLSNDQGALIADGVILRSTDKDWFLTLAVRCLDWLTLSASGFDCHVEDVSEQLCTFAVEGPSACAALLAAGCGGLEALRPGAVRLLQIGTANLVVARVSATGGLGYEVRCSAEDALFVFDRIYRDAALFRPVLVGQHARDVARLEAGHPKVGRDYHPATTANRGESRTVLELGLGGLIGIEGDPFSGRSALKKQQLSGAKHALVGLELDGSEVPVDLRLSDASGVVGKLTSVSWSPSLKRIVALAEVEAKVLGSANRFQVSSRTGSAISAAIVPRPFYICPNARRTPPDAH